MLSCQHTYEKIIYAKCLIPNEKKEYVNDAVIN